LTYNDGDVSDVTCSETGHAHHTANSLKEMQAYFSFIFEPFLAGAFIIISLIISILFGLKLGNSQLSVFSFIGLTLVGTFYGILPLLVGLLITIATFVVYTGGSRL
jgi:hypothetical protein